MLMDVYKRRLSTSNNVTNARAKWIESGQAYFNRYAPESPAFNHVMIDDVEEDVLIISRELPTEKTIRAMPGRDFQVGQILTWKDSHWLITQRDNDDAVTVKGKIEQCNRQLKWQNPDTGMIITRWCTAKKPYYRNMEADSYMVQSTREFKVQLPYDDETAKIDLYKRFMMEIIDGNPKVYKVSSVDQTTERYDRSTGVTGFLILNIIQDLYNPETDNAELGICDYVSVTDPELNYSDSGGRPIPPSKISYNGLPQIRYGGSQKKLTFEISNITDYTDAPIRWTLHVDRGYEDKYDLVVDDEQPNVVYIKAEDYAMLDGQTVTVYAKDGDSKARAGLVLEVIG